MQVLRLSLTEGRYVPQTGGALPLAALLVGRPVAEAAILLPRLFNLCRMAQGVAARMCLGLPETTAPDALTPDALTKEILRDHLFRLFHILPPFLGLASAPLPQTDLAIALFGPRERLPLGLGELEDWLEAGMGCAPLVDRIKAVFRAGEAISDDLPLAQAETMMSGAVLENSAAARQAGHPLLRSVAAHYGRGPLWRVLGMLADAEAAFAGRLPAPIMVDGAAVVPAARGLYALEIRHDGGVVTSLSRVTPTDQQCAPNGALQTALSRLPPAKAALAPLIVALHDPCIPVEFAPETGVGHA